MALQSSGSISFSQIAAEFGLPPGNNLGAYRLTDTVANLTRPLDDDIPISGEIKFSNFYGKRLNIIIECVGNRIIARNSYNNNNRVFPVGRFKTRPSSSSGTKVWIHTNTTVGSDKTSSSVNREYASLLTGSWDSGTDLRVDIGSSAIITGAGGNGGAGGNAGQKFANSGSAGSKGTTALGIQYSPTIITNRGQIRGGGGGGGGGGGSWNENRRRNERDVGYAAGGGGGGGGWGSPAGQGGSGGTATASGGSGVSLAEANYPGSAGSSGSLNSAGNGGNGGGSSRDSAGGGGGGGANGIAGSNGNDPGSAQTNPTNGSTTSGGNGAPGYALGGTDGRTGVGGLGASGGPNGFSILVSNDGTGIQINNNNTIVGTIQYNTNPQ